MNWCTIEWPTKTHPTTVARVQTRRSGKKATLAGLLGILVLLLMVAVVIFYAWWSQGMNLPQAATQAEVWVNQLIKGQVQVTLTVGGKTSTVETTGKTVQDVLTQQGIVLQQKDTVTPALTVLLEKDMPIKVTRVDVRLEKKEIPLPFVTERLANPELPHGFTRKIKSGKEGVLRETWQIRLEDEVEVSRSCIAREVVQEPVNGLIQYGTLSTVSRGGQDIRFSRALEMVATAYTYTGNNTASGTIPALGVAAVDPRVIPLGSQLFVEGYGSATALDTGGAIKGNRIDLFYPTENQARHWGVKSTKVYVLDKS
ncbi:3D domain-containing protein [Desulforamulus aeronauticus]|uniref:3D (Asp-Asp-Asp) domain-containing protein n=1 Tax=Desulforamulus aeronauticus DSM 10349 TaxID=1121421 RepID=A0A1M6RNX2_9FIRM|nr:3D domain-containing protein [Desulforamulus aeronauticus]SHK34166.1 3D (Asp-Asp-Asp) domain-containing protein [Desulforamulus aeronauticus DSM 10349]